MEPKQIEMIYGEISETADVSASRGVLRGSRGGAELAS